MDNNNEQAVARNLRIDELTLFRPHGGGPGTVTLASMAIATGKARTVICYRAMNERSQQRFGQPSAYGGGPITSMAIDASWTAPFGMATPASFMAQSARRYLHQYGATSEASGARPVSSGITPTRTRLGSFTTVRARSMSTRHRA